MANSQREAIKEGKDEYWWQGRVVCCACGNTQYSAIPIPVEWDEPIIPIQCSKCEGMTCNPE